MLNQTNQNVHNSVTKNINSKSNTHLHSNTQDTTDKDNYSLILEARKLLYENNITKAMTLVKEARINDVEDMSLRAFDTALQQWNSYILETRALHEAEDKGDFLFKKWNSFYLQYKNFSSQTTNSRIPVLNTQTLDAIQHFIIKLIQVCYRNTLRNIPEKKQNLHFKLKVFKCIKLLGEYEKAWHFMRTLCTKSPQNAYLMSQLADCYSLIGKESTAKLLFKEVFYLNPTEIVLQDLESVFINNIVNEVRNEGKYNEKYLLEWIPVYGYIMKIFSISRQLKPIEVDTILTEINEMEAKLDDHRALGRDDPFIIMPRLLNRFFWIIDYYKHEKNSTKISHILSKIQNLDEAIYKKLEL